MNRKLKRELAYITYLFAGIALRGAIWTGYQSRQSVIEIWASEKPYYEPISFIEPTIEERILEVFRDDMEISVAESHLNPERCHNDEREYYCRQFQINLRAHYEKVPGDSFEEKAEWLKDPEHNIKIAEQIYDTSYWHPWSVYLNGSYKKFL